MNERFLFRVWDNIKNQYIDKGLMHRNGYIVMPTMKNDFDLSKAKCDCVIEQCTGLKDKNGKLIYEGDIIKSGNDAKYIFYEDGAYYCKDTEYDIVCHIYQSWLKECKYEVVGNIHENKELLK